MKIYLAGKISGNPNYKEEFDRHAIAYEAEGHIVLNVMPTKKKKRHTAPTVARRWTEKGKKHEY